MRVKVTKQMWFDVKHGDLATVHTLMQDELQAVIDNYLARFKITRDRSNTKTETVPAPELGEVVELEDLEWELIVDSLEK